MAVPTVLSLLIVVAPRFCSPVPIPARRLSGQESLNFFHIPSLVLHNLLYLPFSNFGRVSKRLIGVQFPPSQLPPIPLPLGTPGVGQIEVVFTDFLSVVFPVVSVSLRLRSPTRLDRSAVPLLLFVSESFCVELYVISSVLVVFGDPQSPHTGVGGGAPGISDFPHLSCRRIGSSSPQNKPRCRFSTP